MVWKHKTNVDRRTDRLRRSNTVKRHNLSIVEHRIYLKTVFRPENMTTVENSKNISGVCKVRYLEKNILSNILS